MDSPQPPQASAPAPGLSRWFADEVQPHEPSLRAWLRSRFPTLGDIDDLIQESYLRILRARGAGRLQHPKAYLFATARNAALDRCRREQVISFSDIADLEALSVLEEKGDAAEAADHDHELVLLTEAIRALPGRCREVLVLRKHHGLSHREIAQRLGISPHTVNAQLTVAMMKCREYFRAHGVFPASPHETSVPQR